MIAYLRSEIFDLVLWLFMFTLKYSLYILQLAGVWFEILRAPNMDVLSCLNVTVPDKAESDLVLDLEYINTWDQSQSPAKETVSFPWDDYTKNSIFNLYYGAMGNKPTVTYKVVFTDYRQYTAICGFSGISPMPLMKLFSRRRHLDKKDVDNIEAQLDKIGLSEMVTWTEQTKCNAADRSVAGIISTVAIAILWMLSKWC